MARITGVLVSGAVRASVLAMRADACPTDLNRATLSWYERSDLRRRELLDAERRTVRDQLSAWIPRPAMPSASSVGSPISIGLFTGSALHSNQPPS